MIVWMVMMDMRMRAWVLVCVLRNDHLQSRTVGVILSWTHAAVHYTFQGGRRMSSTVRRSGVMMTLLLLLWARARTFDYNDH
jgi:hypothetical protein